MRGFELSKGYDGKLPVIANVGDGGADFYTAERVVLRPGTINTLIPTSDNKNKPFKLSFRYCTQKVGQNIQLFLFSILNFKVSKFYYF